jgi:DNA-binding transcriptional LysR family regulator
MYVTHIRQVDLNLLAPLEALLGERHVSRAADQVGLTQSAMSRALRRLRDILGDELLVRTAGGYQLTPRAERIQRELTTLLPRLEALFAGETFDPSSAAEVFRLAGTDYPAAVFGPALFQRILRQAPRSILRFEALHDRVAEDLESGLIDVMFVGVAAPPNLRSERLFAERFVCVVAADHPLADQPSLSLEDYLRCSHVVVTTQYAHQVVIDQRLQALGTPREANLYVPYHATAALAVPDTRLVATLPSRLAAQHAEDPSLRILRAPAEISVMNFLMSWHPRLDDDPGQRWLRDMIRAVTAGL